MSNVDIAAVLSEIKPMLVNSYINNIFELPGVELNTSVFLFKLRHPEYGVHSLLLEPGKRIHLTKYTFPKPKHPPVFCMTLRKYLRRKRISDVYQHDLDRIVVIEIGQLEDKFLLVIELFGEGNLLLINPQNEIFIAKRYKRMRDRDVIPKAEYEFPPARGIDIFKMTKEKLFDIFKNSESDLIRTLVHFFNVGPTYAEEICLLSQINKNQPTKEISDEEVDLIINATNSIFEKIEHHTFNPAVIYENSTPVDVIPLWLSKYSGQQYQEYESFNDAVDEYFTFLESKKYDKKIDEKVAAEVKKFEKILEKQKTLMEKYTKSIEKNRTLGELIYQNMSDLQELTYTINNALQKGYTWNEINDKIEKAKSMGIRSALIVKEINLANKVLVVNLDNEMTELDLKKSVGENASSYFEKARKVESKLIGAEKAIEETQNKMKTTSEDALLNREKKKYKLKKKRKKKWFEKFHWFISSDGFLVLGGRDAATNVYLVKKHLETHDIFVHAEVRGAPHILIKSQGKQIPDSTIEEAAEFAVSLSRAWKSGYGASDAYWVNANQVSFSPPSGQYLEPGSVMVYGQRNYLKRIPLEFAIGCKIEDDFAVPIGGPPNVIKKQSENYVVLVPGEEKSGKLAKEIKEKFIKFGKTDEIEKIKEISLDDIIRIIPSGGSQFK